MVSHPFKTLGNTIFNHFNILAPKTIFPDPQLVDNSHNYLAEITSQIFGKLGSAKNYFHFGYYQPTLQLICYLLQLPTQPIKQCSPVAVNPSWHVLCSICWLLSNYELSSSQPFHLTSLLALFVALFVAP